MSGPFKLRSFARRGAAILAFNTVIGLALGLVRGAGWAEQMVYAQAIGLSIWLYIDLGRLLWKRDPQTNWPVGWRAVVTQVGGVAGGLVTGWAVGDWYCGCSMHALWQNTPRSFWGYVVVSLAISLGISFFFISRARDQHRQHQLAAAQRDATQARLKLLESQLEPHMLFNTLANLRVLIGLDPPRAQAMLDQLIAFLRATLNASRSGSHPLAAEFERVRDYLDLMKVRMGDRLVTDLDLPPALASHPVPPLLLQPLVENAIKHGLEPQVAGGRLRVSAAHEGEALVLRVHDTGVGLASHTDTSGTQFGLSQVRERLATLYGSQASFSLAAASDGTGGAIATVRLPWSHLA